MERTRPRFHSINVIGTCQGCQDRAIGCHSTCERYIKAKAEHDAQIEFIRKKKKEENAFVQFKIEGTRRNSR